MIYVDPGRIGGVDVFCRAPVKSQMFPTSETLFTSLIASRNPHFYPDFYTTDGLLKDIERYSKKWQEFIETSKREEDTLKYLDEFCEYLSLCYAVNVCLGEGVGTFDVRSMERLSSLPSSSLTSREEREAWNVFQAAKMLFNDQDDRILSVDLIKALHRQIGDGVVPNPGVLRTIFVKPSNMVGEYLAPFNVQRRLVQLVEVTSKWLEAATTSTHYIQIASFFSSSFLYIHPFTDGNGRVSRLLASYLLRKISPVPISLTSVAKDRETYIRALDERMSYPQRSPLVEYPTMLYAFFILKTHEALSTALFSLDAYE